ncbi:MULTISPECIES: paraquat-inducible protein A [Aeromonas]|jgi:paraquat-inducible protein A|uniref:paraquat-inducible protein A n=1 Tax=Aeromonas TaxID=642 RepID=UPI001CC900BB|nr:MULTISPECIES: paraquat-inducible protein A [Aeromonas]MCS3459112.1 paraquat-inducible protein A [Aeromonas sp. BIGb0445]UBO75851.1 paraquat-inducible protein A [Aeromonas rivuli]
MTSARELGMCRCHHCGLLVRFEAGHLCPRCHSALHVRTPYSLLWSWGLLALATFMLLPANLLPITHFYNKGLLQSDTIFSGIMALYRSKMSGIATIVLTASIIVPIMKILGLGWICWQLQRKKPVRRRRQLVMYRIIDFIGRWSMLDLFVISLMVALVDRGVLLNVRAGPGATAFACVVLLTMLSARMLDTRLLWDKAAR